VVGASAGDTFSLGQYVNDRPYAASSMLAVALGKVFRTAMAGRCEARPELPALALPLEIHVPALPSVGGRDLVRRFFEPLGWAVEVTSIPLDLTIPAWGDSEYVDLRLCGTMPLSQALAHLYVLLPVLDNAKHYWVSNDEVDKLVRAGSGWLHEHPERDLIVRRYLKHQKDLVLSAVGRLAEIDDALPESLDNAVADSENPGSDADADAGKDTQSEKRPTPLVEHRRMAVTEELKREGASRVVDLGCGEGTLLRALLKDSSFREILGVDVSHKALELAERRLQLDRAAGHPARPAHAAAIVPYLPRRAVRRFRRRRPDGGHRAPRPAQTSEPRTHRLCPGQTEDGHRDHAQCRAQRQVRVPGCRHDAPPRPPVRVDPGRVRRLGEPDRRPPRLQGSVPVDRRRRPRGRTADPDGRVHAHRQPREGSIMTDPDADRADDPSRDRCPRNRSAGHP